MTEDANASTGNWPKNMDELLDLIAQEWSALMETIAPLTDRQMTASPTGAWSVKDNLAHVAAWERFLLLHHLQGQPPHQVLGIEAAVFDALDEDGQNAIIYERRKDRSVEEVLEDLQRTHSQVLAQLHKVRFADLMRPPYADDPTNRPLMDVVAGNTYEHYQEHRITIDELIRA
jgi:hypothetical protein